MSGKTGGKVRQHPGIKGRRPDLKSFRQKEAIERLVAWQRLSIEEQLAHLDTRLGKEMGAKKQRARLADKIELRVLAGPFLIEHGLLKVKGEA